MLRRWTVHKRMIVVIGAALFVVLTMGCGEKGTVPELPPGEIDALTILCNPLSPAPGEIAQLTTQATGRSGTTWPEYHWVVEAGSLLVDEGISVGWKVPDESGIYHIEVHASLDQSADSLEKDIMVRNFEGLTWDCTISGSAKSVTSSYFPIQVSGGVASISYGRNWYTSHPVWGYHVLIKSGTSVYAKTDFFNDGQYLYGGNYFTINTNVNQILGSMYSTSSGYYRQQRMDVWLFPLLGFGSPINITESDNSDESDDPMVIKNRKNQHVYPVGNEALDMVVWQQNITGIKPDGTDDEFNIGFSNSSRWNSSWNEGQPPTFMTLTQSYYITIKKIGAVWDTSRVYYKNIHPILPPQNDHIIYFVDSTGTFEPCLVPIVGSEPDTLQRRALMLGLDHGIFWLEGIEVGEKTLFEWNPASNLLGFIDTRKFLCFFDYQTETVTRMTSIGKVNEFAWSPDGSLVAVIKEIGVSIVNPLGDDRLIFTKERTSDEIFGINWSPDPADPRLGFRIVRKGSGAGESFSAIVVPSSDNDLKWYYASPRVDWYIEPTIEDYRWLRVLFEQDNAGIYAPVPVANVSGREVVIYHSFE
ncbi:MAG TPA: hypothetical protein VMX58_00675 [Patescibacteria group bacterium]|nr:hypothetical protein [Patescibacteria group bacterium]